MAVGGLSERLAFILELDPSNAIAGMRRVGTEADRSLGNVDDRLNRIGGRMQIAGAGAVAFAGVAGRALFSFAQASEEANLAQVRLQNSIENSPELAGASAEAFNDLATAIQSKTAADGDQIVSAMAMLGTFHQTEDQIRSITPLVVDYARKFGVDLVTAATQVGKALDGNIGTLQRNGINIDENAYATDRFAAVTAALRENVGGFAEQEGATFSGQLERLKNQLGDVAEGIGGGVIGAVNDMIGPVTSAAEAFTRLDAGTQETIGQFAAYGTAAIGLAGATSFAIGSIVKMVDNFRTAKEAVSGFVGSGGLGRIATVAVPVVGALALFGTALQNQAQDAAEAQGRITSLASAIRETGSVAEATTAAFERGELFEGLGMSAQEITSELARLGISLEDLQTRWDDNAESGFVLRDALRAARAEGQLTLEQYDHLARSLYDLEDRIGAARDEADAQAQVLGAVEGATGAATDATEGLTDATEANTGATDDNTRAIQDRANALLSSRDNELSLAAAMLETADQLDSYNAVMADGEATDRERQQASIALEQQFYAEAEAAGRSAHDQAVASGNAAGAQQASTQAQIEALQRLAQNLEPGSPVRNGIESHIMALRSIPTNITTQVLVNTNYGQGTTPLRAGGGGITGGGQSAAGGIVDHPITRVNERGVELYTDPAGHDFLLNGQGGVVTPNHHLGVAATVGGGTIVLQFTGDINIATTGGVDGDDVIDALEVAVRRSGSRPIRTLLGLS